MTHAIYYLLALSFIGLFLLALVLSKRGKFYADSFVFIPFGIYVWGDALILAPFLAVSAVALSFLPVIWTIRFVLLYWSLRNAYEVVYWLNHQSAKDTYVAPAFRNISWLKTNDKAILYQLLAFCSTLAPLFLLMLSYR